MMRTRRNRLAVMAILAAVMVGRMAGAGEPQTASRARQPGALVLVDGGRFLLAANGRSGSISVIDPAARRLVAEHDVGRGLADGVVEVRDRASDERRDVPVAEAAAEVAAVVRG